MDSKLGMVVTAAAQHFTTEVGPELRSQIHETVVGDISPECMRKAPPVRLAAG